MSSPRDHGSLVSSPLPPVLSLVSRTSNAIGLEWYNPSNLRTQTDCDLNLERGGSPTPLTEVAVKVVQWGVRPRPTPLVQVVPWISGEVEGSGRRNVCTTQGDSAGPREDGGDGRGLGAQEAVLSPLFPSGKDL